MSSSTFGLRLFDGLLVLLVRIIPLLAEHLGTSVSRVEYQPSGNHAASVTMKGAHDHEAPRLPLQAVLDTPLLKVQLGDLTVDGFQVAMD